MNPKVEKIFKLPFTAKIGIAVACLALLGGGYWYMFYSALDEQFAALAEETEKLKAEVAEKRAIAANLDKFLAEVDRLDEELKKALLELPDKREIPQLLERISDKARDAGLDVRLFRPQVVALIQARDRVLAEWRRRYPGRDVLEDCQLEVTSTLEVSLEGQIRAVAAALGRARPKPRR